MKLYAQQGYGTGNGEGDRIIAGLQRGYIDGVILSPKDFARDRAVEELKQIEAEYPNADRLFDPQWYATVLAHDPDSRLGKLASVEYGYFDARRRYQLESENQVRADLERCLSFQAELPLTAVIAPSIVIRERFNSVEAVISKNFIRNARSIWNSVGNGRPLLVTLAIDAEALQDPHALDEFLSEITLLEEQPDGFYLLVNNPTSEIAPELIDARTLAGWMLVNHSLHLNGYQVVNGFSDILTPFLAAAGGAAGATGWFNTQKVFSLLRFTPSPPGGRRPVFRYLSTPLLNSIRYDELQFLRGRFPEIVNGLQSDEYYDVERGSEPQGQIQEVLQTWEAIRSLDPSSAPDALKACAERVTTANALYEKINLSPGMRLMGRSNGNHLVSIQSGLHLFAEMAEIEL